MRRHRAAILTISFRYDKRPFPYLARDVANMVTMVRAGDCACGAPRFLFCESGLSYNLRRCHHGCMRGRDSNKWRDRALAIEFWIATIVVGGSFLVRSEEHTSELQSLMRISYAVFCLKKK